MFSFGAAKSADQRKAGYKLVLRECGEFRLILTLKGARYCLQSRLPSGRFQVVAWSQSLSELKVRFPDGVAFANLAALPDAARSCPLIAP